MHYYGTYALARAGGLRSDVARRIAMASEFVDDSTAKEVIINPNGARFRGETTAHHPYDLAPNNDHDDQLNVWVPFHFLPGVKGENQSQRLTCLKDSEVAQQMVAHHLSMVEAPFAAELIGVTAHVYADTFAHYGFSGVSSRLNRVKGDTIQLVNGNPDILMRFFGKFGFQGGLLKNFRQKVVDIESEVAADSTGALGHGPVATFPDQPFLEWSYEYERGDLVGGSGKVERQNAKDYLAAAEALYGMFRRFAEAHHGLMDDKGLVEFSAIAGKVQEILATVTDTNGRVSLWKAALAEGKLCAQADDTLPDYSHVEWRSQSDQLGTLGDPQQASEIPVYQFYQAAALHRHYILRELLPSHGLYVV